MAASTPKQKLVELIDAFATAKGTGNQMLINLSVKLLDDFLKLVDVVELDSGAQADDFELPTDKPIRTTKSSSKL